MRREAHDDVRHLQARPTIVSCGMEITGLVFPRVPAHKATAGAANEGRHIGGGDGARRWFIGRDVGCGFRT